MTDELCDSKLQLPVKLFLRNRIHSLSGIRAIIIRILMSNLSNFIAQFERKIGCISDGDVDWTLQLIIVKCFL